VSRWISLVTRNVSMIVTLFSLFQFFQIKIPTWFLRSHNLFTLSSRNKRIKNTFKHIEFGFKTFKFLKKLLIVLNLIFFIAQRVRSTRCSDLKMNGHPRAFYFQKNLKKWNFLWVLRLSVRPSVRRREIFLRNLGVRFTALLVFRFLYYSYWTMELLRAPYLKKKVGLN
jgi:hypothetical protein